MSAGLKLKGMTEFREALKSLSGPMLAEAVVIVELAADGTASDVVAKYPERAYGRDSGRGNLKRGVRVEKDTSSGATLRARVISAAAEAHLYEFGTQIRSTKGKGKYGAGVNRGASPAHPTVIPAAIRRRREMLEQLVALVRRAGFEVRL